MGFMFCDSCRWAALRKSNGAKLINPSTDAKSGHHFILILSEYLSNAKINLGVSVLFFSFKRGQED